MLNISGVQSSGKERKSSANHSPQSAKESQFKSLITDNQQKDTARILDAKFNADETTQKEDKNGDSYN